MLSFIGFQLFWLKRALKQCADLEQSVKTKVVDKIDLLVPSASQLDIKKLRGHDDLYRIRVGDYRVIFQVISSAKSIHIIYVSHRRDIYKNFSDV